MKVKDLISALEHFNQEARVDVVVHCHPEEFSLSWGGCEGSEKETCDSVSFYVDRLCSNEQTENK